MTDEIKNHVELFRICLAQIRIEASPGAKDMMLSWSKLSVADQLEFLAWKSIQQDFRIAAMERLLNSLCQLTEDDNDA